jgi:hypothetical protein
VFYLSDVTFDTHHFRLSTLMEMRYLKQIKDIKFVSISAIELFKMKKTEDKVRHIAQKLQVTSEKLDHIDYNSMETFIQRSIIEKSDIVI